MTQNGYAVPIDGQPGADFRPQEVPTYATAQRYEEAGAIRDDAMRLPNSIVKHRRTEALRRSSRLVIEICGDGTVELHQGAFVESRVLVPGSMMHRRTAVAAQRLHVNAALVRVVHSEHPLCWPAARIPELTDLVLTQREPDSSIPSVLSAL
jgi:hypothetical protein